MEGWGWGKDRFSGSRWLGIVGLVECTHFSFAAARDGPAIMWLGLPRFVVPCADSSGGKVP